MIDLDFDTAKEAEALLAALRLIWGRVEGTVISDPKARIVEAVETWCSDHPSPRAVPQSPPYVPKGGRRAQTLGIYARQRRPY